MEGQKPSMTTLRMHDDARCRMEMHKDAMIFVEAIVILV